MFFPIEQRSPTRSPISNSEGEASEVEKQRSAELEEQGEDAETEPEDEAPQSPNATNPPTDDDEEITDLTMEPFELYKPTSTCRKYGNHTKWTISKNDRQHIENINSQMPAQDDRYHVGPYESSFAQLMTPGTRFPKRQWKQGEQRLTANNGHVDLTYDADSYRHMGMYLGCC